jgi:hypothetical protein
MRQTTIVWAGIAMLAGVLNLPAQEAISIRPITIHAPVPTSSDDLATMIEAVEQTTPQPAESAVSGSTFWSAQRPTFPPFPANFNNTPAWDLGNGVWLLDDLAVDYSAAPALSSSRNGGMRALEDEAGPPSPGDGDGGGTNTYGGGFSPAISFPTNNLWLQISNVANGLASLNLMNGTDSVYEIYSTVAVVNGSNAWNIAAEVWPTNPAVMPFSLPESDPTNLFIWARDWTGITSDGNTTPEWWFWKYFGTTELADTNLDSQGTNTLLYDYTNSLDPNIITFAIVATNNYVNATTISVPLNITAGAPDYYAVFVNDNMTTNWLPFVSTNLAVYLGSTDGVYTVNVGLRGLPPEAAQTWNDYYFFTLDRVAPTVTVTNPVVSTVSVPLVQVQGFANENLSSLTYDVSNAAGIFTNQTGYVTDEFWDTNLSAFTTNYFQCYDVGLTNGANIITVHATDLAGNVTTTNVSYTLSYAGVTNPPTLNLIWPTNGTVVSGSNFTMQAQMDDYTATVTAAIVSTNGDTNMVTGLVERNGTVWFNDLPLNSGTNAVTITATSAAGNATITNLNLIQSSVSLTIDPISSDQMNQSSVSVTGTIADTNDTVRVNGTNAYFIDDAGDWEADNVPVNATGTASLNVQVTDVGNNPIASQNVYQPQPAQVGLMSYSYKRVVPLVVDISHWTYLAGGDSAHDSIYVGFSEDPFVLENGWENNSFTYPVYAPDGQGTTTTQTKVMIVPPGQAAVGGMKSYLLLVQVWGEDAVGDEWPLDPQMVTIGGQTLVDTHVATNADGSGLGAVLVQAPAGAMPEVTPIAKGNTRFVVQTANTKADWQQMVRNEIAGNSGVDLDYYLANNGFSANTANIQAVYAFYQKVYLEQPTEYYWCGLARLAGAPVYAALTDAQSAWPYEADFQQTLIGMNIAILNDLAWQFEAYRKGGLDALEEIYAVDILHTNLDLNAITAWRNIDQGIQQNNQALILEGNEALLQREQQQVLAFGYTQLSSMTGITTVMSVLAQCPIWDPSTSPPQPYSGRGFASLIGIPPSHNLAVYNDRWAWITYPTIGIWDTWVNLSLSDKTNQVSVPLITRATTYY